MMISALILAGGQSSRMGRDKALIFWDGTPMLKRVGQVAAQCCQQVYVLSPWCDRYQNILPSDYHFIGESHPGQGPLVALDRGLEQIPTEWILLLACDLPLLQVDILKHWSEQLDRLPATILALVPRRDDRWEPLCAFYRREARSQLQKFIQQGGHSFQVWLEQIPVQPLPVTAIEAQMLWNCNTQMDLKNINFLD